MIMSLSFKEEFKKEFIKQAPFGFIALVLGFGLGNIFQITIDKYKQTPCERIQKKDQFEESLGTVQKTLAEVSFMNITICDGLIDVEGIDQTKAKELCNANTFKQRIETIYNYNKDYGACLGLVDPYTTNNE